LYVRIHPFFVIRSETSLLPPYSSVPSAHSPECPEYP
jgi:hypothetical protein